jgi:glycerophosphoryl diester phosphodiesterase
MAAPALPVPRERTTPPPGLAWRRTVRALRPRLRAIATWQLLATLTGTLVLAPLASRALDALLRRAGTVAVSNFELVGFFLSPTGAAYAAVGTALVLALFLVQHAGLVLLTADDHERDTPLGALARVARAMPQLLGVALRQLAILGALLVPFAAAPVAYAASLLRAHDVNWYLATTPPEWWRLLALAGVLLAVWATLALRLLARWALAVPAVMHEGRSGIDALRTSARMTRGHRWAIARAIVSWWVMLLALQLACSALVGRAGTVLVRAAGDRLALLVPAVTCTLVCLGALAIAWVLIGHAGHARIVNVVWREDGGTDTMPAADDAAAGALRPWSVAAALVVATAASSLVAAQRLASLPMREDVEVTGHRGAAGAPENSLAAVRAAIDAGADWVEIDVQRTKDGAVVVVHDADLMRMARVPGKIRQMTLAQVRRADIGRLTGARFAGERVPTLSEVLALARGHVKVNIELKYNGPDPALVPAVLEIVAAEGAADRVSLTSLDHAALAEVERRQPELRTGMIVTRAIGAPTGLGVDFLSVNRSAVTTTLLERAHRAGKEVHAWTINDRRAMARMIELGVDNLITDFPGVAVSVRAERAALEPHERLALRMRQLLATP